MKRRANKGPRGPRGGAARGGPRGRGRGSRGGSKSNAESTRGGGSRGSSSRGNRGQTHHFGRGMHNNNLGNDSRGNGIVDSNNKCGRSESNAQCSAPKSLPSDCYLHKKFKKLTTVSEVNGSESLPSASNSAGPHETILRNETSPSKQSGQGTAGDGNSQCAVASSSSVVYKPKFRIASDSDTPKPSLLPQNGHSPSNISASISSASSSSSLGDSDATSCTEAGKVSKVLRLDRQSLESLDDRISKIIDENQSLLEWPEHFTKKLKSHTSLRTSRSNQIVMSGGFTTELHSRTNPPYNPLTHNGVARHPSYDMTASSGGTVEFLTNPLILKAQTDILKTSFAPPTAAAPSISELLGVVPGSNSRPIVPKKRRRLSPTPSRLCGGEVSELPVHDVGLSKNSYQDVDMNVRVNNCSGAKVTIRTSNSGTVQSGVNFGRFIEQVPCSLGINTSSSLFFPTPNAAVATNRDENVKEIDGKSTSVSKSLKRKQRSSRGSKATGESSSSSPRTQSFSGPVPTHGPYSSLDVITTQKELSPGSTSSRSSGPLTPPTINSSTTSSSPKISPTTAMSPPKREPATIPPPSFQPSSNGGPKRPTFLALKPVNNVIKKRDLGVGVLPSPETPRVAKSYNQMSINGNAYTYLGFKVSTRSSYTCLFKPQPMFIPQSRDPKLSMYSNWQPCPKDPKEPELNMGTNDSRVNGRKDVGLYTSAVGNNCDTMTVSSPGQQPPITSPMSETSSISLFANGLKTTPTNNSITSLSRSSEPTTSNSKVLSYPTTTGIPTTAPSNKSPPSPNHMNSTSTITSSVARVISMLSSSSDVSSGEEGACGESFIKRNKDTSSPLSLILNSKDDAKMNNKFMREDSSNSASDSIKSDMILSRSDASRVRVMEGGFESNEAYTYVRGRGRGRYVCEACGIRCKKPSMLRKHLKTHTDLRPYTCKLCNFSFKTKGNLTKHQKSKSHHKKCISLGIHPDSSQSLASTGPNISADSDDSDGDDDDENGDSDSQDCDGTSSAGNDSESVEKEIALSLLDLSRMTKRPSEDRLESSENDDWLKMQKVPQSRLKFPGGESTGFHSDDSMLTKPVCGSNGEAPIDLSVKHKAAPPPSTITITTCEEPETKRSKLELNGVVKSMGLVGEPQRCEELMSTSGSFCLKKVLNTGGSSVSPPKSKGIPANHIETHKPREIKQEVFEYQTDNGENHYNGVIKRFSRTRQNSETSNSSVSSGIVNPSPIAMNELAKDQPGSSSHRGEKTATAAAAPLVRLHQPWLSPPDKKPTDGKMKKDCMVEVKTKGASPLPGKSSPPIVDSNSSDGHEDVKSLRGKVFQNLGSVKPQAEFRQPSGAQALVNEDGKAECNVCGKTFARASQLTLHTNIHYLERPFRCDPCGVSFRTKGHLIKHRRSSSHDCKVYLTEAWGVANEENPRPFKCAECKIAFRIHGHLAKHLRSKMHIMRMECLGKLPFGIYFEMEKSGMNLNEIDTTDCDMSLVSLQNVAKKIYGDNWSERLVPVEEPA